MDRITKTQVEAFKNCVHTQCAECGNKPICLGSGSYAMLAEEIEVLRTELSAYREALKNWIELDERRYKG